MNHGVNTASRLDVMLMTGPSHTTAAGDQPGQNGDHPTSGVHLRLAQQIGTLLVGCHRNSGERA
jgi:hypothetical protein